MRGRSPPSHPTTPSSFSLLQIPPLRYELAETDLHRGGYPTLRNFPFLARLHLRTLVSLTPEPPTADLTLFCSHYGVVLHHTAVPYPADSLSTAPATVASALSIVLSRSALPAYVHCLDGRSVTSGVVAVLRRLQHWRLDSCVNEYERMCGAGTGEAVRELLEKWTEPVRLSSQSLPSWLWDGKWCAPHPTCQLLDDSEAQTGGDSSAAEPANTSAAPAVSEKKRKLQVSSSSASQATLTAADPSTSAADGVTADPTAALLARWSARRSWLDCDTLLPSQSVAVPQGDSLYSVDRRMAGSTAYLDCLMLEGYTMLNTFARPLPLLNTAAAATATAAASSVHASHVEIQHPPA